MPKKYSRGPITTRLKEAIHASGLSLNQIGQRAGLDHSRLSRFVRGERDLTLESVDKLCQALGLHLAPDPDKLPGPTAQDRGGATAEKAPKSGKGRK